MPKPAKSPSPGRWSGDSQPAGTAGSDSNSCPARSLPISADIVFSSLIAAPYFLASKASCTFFRLGGSSHFLDFKPWGMATSVRPTNSAHARGWIMGPHTYAVAAGTGSGHGLGAIAGRRTVPAMADRRTQQGHRTP